MKELVIGTSNPAKVDQIRGALSSLSNLTVVGINNNSDLPNVVEDGITPQENARRKALAFARVLDRPALSMDNALYFDDLEGDEKQPGINVRRFVEKGRRPSDKKMVRYYSQLIKSLGDEIKGRWEFAVCIATPNGDVMETTIISPRTFTSVPSRIMVEGYPLESLQKDPETSQYISEMTPEEKSNFWNRMLGKPLQEFVSSATF